jgi:hypothetical protein
MQDLTSLWRLLQWYECLCTLQGAHHEYNTVEDFVLERKKEKMLTFLVACPLLSPEIQPARKNRAL